MVAAGIEVEWFAASFPGAQQEESIDGVRIVREGRQWTVHLRAFHRYRGRLRNHFDAVIDQVNTVPFFTPLWARVPVFMMMWQLAREVWWYENLRVYRNCPVFTFSQSTAADLRRLGFQSDITVVPVGVEDIEASHGLKSTEATFIYVGRLAPSKRIHEILQALAIYRQVRGDGRLLLVGNGAEGYVRSLNRLAAQLGISDAVEHCGWLLGPAKHKRMSEAHVLLMASAREGWGLVVTECNACGTPAVVYDVPGLRDSVRHLQTGLVVRPKPRYLAEGMLQLTGDPNLYRRLQDEAKRWSQTFTYESGTRIVFNRLNKTLLLSRI